MCPADLLAQAVLHAASEESCSQGHIKALYTRMINGAIAVACLSTLESCCPLILQVILI